MRVQNEIRFSVGLKGVTISYSNGEINLTKSYSAFPLQVTVLLNGKLESGSLPLPLTG